MKLKFVLSTLAFWAQNVEFVSSKHIGDLEHVSEEFYSEGSKQYFADEIADEGDRRFLANGPIIQREDYTQDIYNDSKRLTFTFENIPKASSNVKVTFKYSGDINVQGEKVIVRDRNNNEILEIGEGNVNASKCGNKAKNPNNEERRNNCCTVTESKTFSKNAFNRLRKGNGKVVFKMRFTNSVTVGICKTNRFTIKFTPPETQAPAPMSSPTTSPFPTAETPEVVDTAFLSIAVTSGPNIQDCEDNLDALETAQQDAAEIGAAASCSNIQFCDFVVSSTRTPCSQARRQLKMTSSRLLQNSYEGSVTTTTAITAPLNAVNANTASQNIGQAVSQALQTLQSNGVPVSSQSTAPAPAPTPVAPPVYVEPPSPCQGVTCNNAGKCQVTSPTTAQCKCENTFVVSESGLGCECLPGHEFNADVNRCFPPPTAAPTKSPTMSPSSVPSTTETTSPSVEIEPIEVCVDNMNTTFPLIFVDAQVNCEWLYMNKEKAEVRQEMYCGLNRAKLVCPQTCDFCSCEDSSSYKFDLMYIDDPDKKADCSWLTRNWKTKEDRIARYCTDDFDDGKLVNACTKSCGLCVSPTKSNEKV